jgi:uncharacterized repeat protein (TIGR01451 family)
MNFQTIRSYRYVLPLLVLAGIYLILTGSPVAYSQDETPTATATETSPPPTDRLSIAGVQPGTIQNDNEVEIVITGSGFANGAVVVLSNFGGLETVYVSSSVLRALVPVGVPAAIYSVRVVNPDAGSAELLNALTVTAPAGPTATLDPSRTPEPTPFVRPLLVVHSYGASAPQITPGQNLDFEMTIANAGQAAANNILATFVSGDFVPRDTGGVRALGTLVPGDSIRFWQPLYASPDLRGKTTAVLLVRATYTDVNGQSYDSAFELTFPVLPQPGGGAAPTATPTPTPTVTPTAGPRLRPQLLVTSSSTDPAQLEPGRVFMLTITVENEGEANARNVSMVLGGGSASGGTVDGTPEAGGVSGGSGEFTEFAPIGSSNVSRLGDLAVGQSKEATQQLVVNTTTDPGAYPIKVSFVYTDDTGVSYVDDQVITLLVFQQPQVEMGFYIPPPPLFAGQPGSLPLQLVNTGRTSTIFGNFSVTAPNSELSNNAIFVGALEPGGFFPLDAMVVPFESGPLDLELAVTYTDDFNRPAVITETLTVDVLEAPDLGPFEPGMGEGGEGGEMPPVNGGTTQETLWQRILRFIRGLLGLGSGQPESGPEQPFGPVEQFVEPEFSPGG